MLVCIRGAGDLASGCAVRLSRAGMDVVMLDVAEPTSVRRSVCFSEAVRLGEATVEDIRGVAVDGPKSAFEALAAGNVAVMVDPDGRFVPDLAPDALVDAILAKRNLGTTRSMAPIVVGVGPGFTASIDVDAAVETQRGHDLGRVYYQGSPAPNTGIPGNIGGYTTERVLRAPADGAFLGVRAIGDVVSAGDVVATVDGVPLVATIDGVLRGLLQDGLRVTRGMKSGDIDPRCEVSHCFSVSDKARAVAGGVLEAVEHFRAFPRETQEA
ncbi:EF2563 family selenium-dependent molybdenum hydroxylase system protein [Olsenella sp. KGMB02461]|nr:EF2563 family selenium-dependent molybdenum hydroxylase system protein [Olsenella sp. KGMB02461]